MKGAILVSAGVSSLVSIIGTIVALNVLAPAVVEAQQPSNILAERAAVVDGAGTERVIMSTGPGARSAVAVFSQDGIPRVSMATGGGRAAPGGFGTEPDQAVVQVFPAEGGTGFGGPGPIASLGTGPDGAGSVMYLRDRQGQIRVLLLVDADGNPSIRMLDASGNVTWQAQ